jgi:hypothetical protein
MRLGESIATYDVGLALRGKSGRFEVTSRAGDIYDVTCKPSQSGSNLEWAGDGTDTPFLIRKVAEDALPTEMKASPIEIVEEPTPVAPSPLPFVLEQTAIEESPSSTGSMELLYLEEDPGTGQPSACISMKSESRDHSRELPRKAEVLLTSRCTTLNELDSEIRRLEAQLDEIRSRAKKMFYKSQAVAASA